jgi:soluble lytic murein transglycosylase-like protein
MMNTDQNLLHLPDADARLRWKMWQRSGGCRAGLAVLLFMLLLLLGAPPARADIWVYVDAERMPHFASTQLDERYELVLRDSKEVEPYRRSGTADTADTADTAQNTSGEASDADPARDSPTVALTDTAGANAVAPRLLSLFAHSESYRAVSPLLREASRTHGIDYSLLKALIATESGFNPRAVSPKGAVGLMQLIPPTAQRYGVTASKGSTVAKKLTDPRINIRAGARYLADLIRMFPGRLDLALAAYNAGEGAVQRAGNKIPNYPETQNYVKTVMQLHAGLKPPSVKTAGGRVRVEMQRVDTARSEGTPSLESLDP